MDIHGFARDRNQGVWIEHSDRLYVAAYSSVASLVVQFSGYFRKANGDIIEYAVTINPTSDRVVTESNVFFGAGFLLSCVATLASGNANRGQCYVRAMVQRSTGTPMVKLHNVLGGYLTDDFSPSFPYGQIESPLEGAGYLRTTLSAVPAAGAGHLLTVPTGARWKLLALWANLTTDGTAANRQVRFRFNVAGTFMAAVIAPSAATSNLTVVYSVTPSGEGRNLTDVYTTPALPYGFFLSGGDTIDTDTFNLQAADQWTALRVYAEEWIEA